jgi:hypothetical protein
LFFVKIECDFTKVAAIRVLNFNETIDVIGIITEIHNLDSFPSKIASGQMLNRKKLTIADETNYCINVTFWNKNVRNFLILISLKDCI